MLQPSATRGTTFITQGARDTRAGHGCHTANGLQGSSSDQEQKQPSLQVSSTPIPPMAGGSSRAPEQLRVSWENSHAAPYRRGFSKGSPLPCSAKTQACRRLLSLPRGFSESSHSFAFPLCRTEVGLMLQTTFSAHAEQPSTRASPSQQNQPLPPAPPAAGPSHTLQSPPGKKKKTTACGPAHLQTKRRSSSTRQVPPAGLFSARQEAPVPPSSRRPSQSAGGFLIRGLST